MSYFRNVKDFDTIKDLHPLTTREITCRFDVDWRQELDKALSFQSQRTAGSYARILVSLFKQREGHLRLSSLEIEPEDAVRVRELLTECGYNLEIYQERAYIPRF